MFAHPAVRWVVLVVGVFALILIPFMVFGEQIEAWTYKFLESASERPVQVALVLGGLLGGDILLPVPSSLASTAAGFILGFFRGMLASWLGMTVSCVLGYWVGAKLGRGVTHKLVGEDEVARLEELTERFGDWVLIISRPVPMLAEASVLFAGISNMVFPRFLILTTLSNLGVSAMYAFVGAFSSTVDSFLLAFFGAILVPGLAMLVMNRSVGNKLSARKTQPVLGE